MCFNMFLLSNANSLFTYNYFFFYNKFNFNQFNFGIKNNFFLNFFRLNWFKNKIVTYDSNPIFLKFKTNKLFFFNIDSDNIFNYFLKKKYLNCNNFYNFNKNIINKNYFCLLKLHFYFFKYFFLVISNIKYFLNFNYSYIYLLKTKKISLLSNFINNLNLSDYVNLRKKNNKNLLTFNKIL